jgi:hypothetical protein
VWAHDKRAELEGLDDNYVCDFCKCDVSECVRILNDQENPICSVLGCRPRMNHGNNS